ncbi:MAG TPA: exodeoxyribonuclease VII large subunit [Bacteroidales bacterium]|nr:exodeoxyribonuclease VII large subunit [Bacteroidales bacterium]
MKDNKAVSLCELLTQVKIAMKNSLPLSWWVIAEISELKVNFNGHCYLELVEKNQDTESVKAKVRATIWASVFRMVQPYFQTSTGMELSAGIKIMIKVSPEFHELYGFSLNVTDIEPSYTLGEMARQRQEIINRLKAEGVYDMNRSLTICEIPSRIAVISSQTAAGLGDFMHQLTNNAYGYKFCVKLFTAVMQGEEAEQSVIQALDKIYQDEASFDVVAIIRGGGSQSDLSCFNSYWLNYNICQFPLPVLTGIGHEQDETIADMVAWKRLKTPTAVAEFLIDCFRETEVGINERSINLFNLVTGKVRAENERLIRVLMALKPAVKERLRAQASNLKVLGLNLKNSAGNLVLSESAKIDGRKIQLSTKLKEYLGNLNHNLELLEKHTSYLDPFLILKRGYSVTYLNGKVLKNNTSVKPEDIIDTRLAEGVIKSKIV